MFVRWGWLEGWEGEEAKFGRDARRNVERKSCGTFFLRKLLQAEITPILHLGTNVVTVHDVCLWHEDRLAAAYPKAYPKTISLPVNRHARL